MSRRIEIELTSVRDDATFTWRAAGARQPKGVVAADVLPSGAGVGDVIKVEVDTGLDGTEVIGVVADRGPRKEAERIEIMDRGVPEELVTTTLAPKRGRGDRADRGDRRGGRRDDRGRDRDRGPRREGEGGERPGRRPRPEGGGRGPGRDRTDRTDRGDQRGERGQGAERARRPRPAPPERPKAPRLRPGRTHRNALLDTLPVEERPVAEQVLRGGVPAVRQAVEKQNEQAKADGRPEVKPDSLVALAERLLPRLKAAEWRDKAEAALADLDALDLRDLRSVVVASDSAARDDEARALATQLREGLARRVEAEQEAWLSELRTTLADGRVVRALRLSSRPPKAGSPLPADLAAGLVEAASAALTAETAPDRWATVVDALSFSPVHARVEPQSIPAEPGDVITGAVQKAATRVPQIASRLGIEPAPAAPRGKRRPPKPAKPAKTPGQAEAPAAAELPAAAEDAPPSPSTTDQPAVEQPAPSPAAADIAPTDNAPAEQPLEDVQEGGADAS